MKLSHSKLSCILNNPAEYYLKYIQKIELKVRKTALSLGSAVHWGIEHNTEDLTEYYKEEGTFKDQDNYTRDQLLAEAMVHGYMKHKDELFEKLLTYKEKKLNILSENHELFLNGKLVSKLEGFHEFIGIIDLLIYTEEGFILVDYKTSSQTPDWDNYLDQLYRYIFLLNSNFPDTPVIKIAIINLRKTNIRQKKNENSDEFLNRLKFEYELNDEEYVNYHEFPVEDIDKEQVKEYIKNLNIMSDMAYLIDKNKMWFVNYANTKGIYGKSDYYDIFFHTKGAEELYKIEDYIYDESLEEFVKTRDCIELDMRVLDNSNILNKYTVFEQELMKTKCNSKELFFEELNKNYITDKNLLEKYWITFFKKKEVINNARK